ncbi:fungal-specific transcription factor domain-containing protein [Ephemerocybe angulata]|uniref:Fungal-specific transcription factor domain-containing protein n=1 Tax=Ephemerocybe angulata TaxID=980116 RepID=A0A8H6IED0_9AGAR|nr:fungal-specific transcription factor domain-containing protein [Tulosesus angulatus]
MPADATSNSKRRHIARNTISDEDLGLRRARGEISCAECRRLKLKCDKKIPCSSCTRRGCPSICPNGSLSTGQGTRFVLADTAQLHSKIAEMGHRIRELEDALSIYHQSSVSTEPHPLLREDLLGIKFGPERRQAREGKPISQPSTETSINAIGTLTIGERGEAKYFGPSAGSETLFLAGADLEDSDGEDEVPSDISIEISRILASFPFEADGNMEKAINMLFDRLPPQTRASSLCETYLEHAAWAFRPIKRDEIMEELLAPIYKALRERQASGTPVTWFSPHKLAVVYLIFALGALVDLTLEPHNKEAESYYNLSRASLALRSVFDSPEISTVHAILLMAAYHGMAGRRYTMDSSWSLTSLGAKLAQSLGLHRDCARWNFDSKTVQRRRSLFWEMFSAEQFYSLALGRPPSIRLSYIDCEFPTDDEAAIDEHGNVMVGYYRWKYEFARDIFPFLIEHTLAAEAPKYETILELDRKVREKTLPPHLNVFMNVDDDNCTPSVYMRRCLLGQYRSVALLYIHRSFFAQAMLDHPSNPLRSPYAPSFLAAYRCASGVIKSCLNHFDRFPDLCGRWWGVWTHLFSAAVIVGSIVTRSPASSMASSAFIELGLACDLFEKGAAHSRRAKSGMAILYKMREKAFQVYSQFRSGNTPIPGVLSTGRPDYGEDELALFGGQTRVLVSRLLSHSKRTGNKRTSSSASSTAPSTNSSPHLSNNESRASSSTEPADVHPSLVEYLSMFPPPNSSPSPPHNDQQYTPHPTFGAPQCQSPDQTSPTTFMSPPQSKAIPPSSWQSWPNHGAAYSDAPSGGYQPNSPPNQPTFDSYSQPPPPSLPNPIPPPGLDPFTPGEQGFPNPDQTNLVDLMMLTGESGIDEQWMSFMRDSGFLDATNTYPQGSHMANMGPTPSMNFS